MSSQLSIYKTGFWSSLLAFIFTTAYCIVQLLQIAGLLYFPLDEILIFGLSLCIVVPFLLAMLALHYTVPFEFKFWTHVAIAFTILYAIFASANYVVQLATVIPALLKDNADDISVLRQTPHSMFWDFDALAYIFMGIATGMAAPALSKFGIQKKLRYFLIANAAITPLIAIVYFVPNFSPVLVLIALPWAITAPGSMLLLALMYKREIKRQEKVAHNRRIFFSRSQQFFYN